MKNTKKNFNFLLNYYNIALNIYKKKLKNRKI